MLSKIFIVIFCGYCLIVQIIKAQDTFSICAFDSVTREVGSAGASCIPGSVIISDVHANVGVVHTQSYWIAPNQNYGKTLMASGRYTAKQIIDSLVKNDAQGDSSVRQYGVVKLDGMDNVAGFTGSNCMDYKNHIVGRNYAIQGNILLGQSVLDSIEARFLRAEGSLACRLMAAMQGAKVPGADARCLGSGTSSQSAFIRVARPDDTLGTIWLNINVYNTLQLSAFTKEPIDSLQKVFDKRNLCGTTNRELDQKQKGGIKIYPNPLNKNNLQIKIASDILLKDTQFSLYNTLGNEVHRSVLSSHIENLTLSSLPNGYLLL